MFMANATVGIGKEQYDDEMFEKAFQAVLQMNKKDYPSYIGGMKIASGNVFAVDSPVDKSIRFGLFQDPESGIEERAIESSQEAFSEWSKMESSKRADYFEKALEAVKVQRYRLAAIVLLSSGMTRRESVAEVDRLIAVMESECRNIKTLKGKPLGIWAIISSHNSPLASPMGLASAAMLAGNTVVVAPSRYCPVPVYTVYEILEKAGLPPGVFNLIADRKDSISENLANDERVVGVAVSGSGKKVEDMIFLQIDDELAFINELKGMNPIIIHKPIDNERAVRDVISSAFSYSGQRLYSTSKLIITEESRQKFLDVLIEHLMSIKVGDPAENDVFMGPIISEENLKSFNKTIDEVKENLLFGGKKVTDDFTQNGCYVLPAVFMGLKDENPLTYMDRGLPLLFIKVVLNIEDAIEEVANTECGLSAGIFTKDQRAISAFRENATAPILFVNESSATIPPALSAKVENFVK